jgi:hypothetical protein
MQNGKTHKRPYARRADRTRTNASMFSICILCAKLFSSAQMQIWVHWILQPFKLSSKWRICLMSRMFLR